jgi:L-threonylcarbamoyladenylate synthase
MQTRILPANSANSIGLALQILQTGGLVAFPTDTVYGIGALAFDGQAVESIYAAKDRPNEKAIPVLLADISELEKVTLAVPEMARRLAARFWPGPLTLVLPKQPALPESVSAIATVAVRVPDHAVARDLLRAAGPMAVTSANISGRPNTTTAQEVFEQMKDRVALILDGGKAPRGLPSTIVDCTQGKPMIVRSGPLSFEEIKSALR